MDNIGDDDAPSILYISKFKKMFIILNETYILYKDVYWIREMKKVTTSIEGIG